MKIITMLGIWIIAFLIFLATAEAIDYTPPEPSQIDLILKTGYTIPDHNSIDLVLGETSTEASLNLSFGPSVDTFRWIGCGPLIINESAEPEGQTSVLGIDYICNNGTAPGNVTVHLNTVPAVGWNIYINNISRPNININEMQNLTDGTTKNIYYNLQPNECKYVWFGATCDQVRNNPRTYEIYNITG